MTQKRWWPVLIPVLISVGLYASSFKNGFVWDDWLVTLDSKGKYISNIPDFFTGHTPYPFSAVWQSLNYTAWGDNARGYHFTNVLLHAGVTAVVYVLFAVLTGSRFISFGTALLFAVHPVHAEPVAWISGYPELLYTLLFLLSLNAGVRSKGMMDGQAIVSVVCYLLALMAKPVAVTLPVVLFAALVWFKGVPIRVAVRRVMPHCVGAALWLFHIRGLIANRISETASQGAVPFDHNYPLVVLPSVLWRYFCSFFWPWFDLSIQHDFSGAWPANLLPAFFFAAVLAGSIWMARKKQWEAMGILWTAVTLSPMLNWPFVAASIHADRYLYLPSVGLCLSVAALSARLWTKTRGRLRTAEAGAAAVMMVLLAVSTLKYSAMWGDERLLYSQAIRTSKNMEYYFRNDLGTAYARKNQFREAEAEFRRSIELNPLHVKPYNNVAWICEKERRWDEGITFSEKAAQLDPTSFIAFNNLGNLCMGKGDLKRAEWAYLKAIEVKPDFSSPLFNLGRLNQVTNRLDQSAGFYEKAIRANPYQQYAHRFLGDVYLAMGNREKARLAWGEALRKDPDRAEIEKRLSQLQ
ncbi:MAG: tetratricopeptide repeat protein [Candidatus Omnitrophica bacterium]|nr:tetratricopeptide repeat protein [Candidatus Omnitrophota bacterium]